VKLRAGDRFSSTAKSCDFKSDDIDPGLLSYDLSSATTTETLVADDIESEGLLACKKEGTAQRS
jgi:hypothetical protein